MRKIVKNGLPLKSWNININYGIKTGFNDAFIISGAKRKELLEQDSKNGDIIRPLLRGRDIKKYSYDFSEIYLITTFPSLKIDIEDYPDVKAHLLSFGYDRLKQTGETGARKKTNNKWFETQDSIGYWEDFYKQKICWKAVGRNLSFAIVQEGIFLSAPASFITSDFNSYILAFLCSSVGKYFIYQHSDTTGAGDIMLNIQSLIIFPIPKIELKDQKQIIEIVDRIIKLKKQGEEFTPLQEHLNSLIYKLYMFSTEEIIEIEKA